MTEASASVSTFISNLPEDVFTNHERLRVTTLQHIAAALRNFPQDADRSQFSHLFDQAQVVLELDDTELARILRVSRPTVGRWARGVSAPHPIGRTPVLITLAEIADAKLKYHASHQAVGACS
jgi:transcriptional regulator with XRE-family HTH domain